MGRRPILPQLLIVEPLKFCLLALAIFRVFSPLYSLAFCHATRTSCSTVASIFSRPPSPSFLLRPSVLPFLLVRVMRYTMPLFVSDDALFFFILFDHLIYTLPSRPVQVLCFIFFVQVRIFWQFETFTLLPPSIVSKI